MPVQLLVNCTVRGALPVRTSAEKSAVSASTVVVVLVIIVVVEVF
jgi:hypothetical protein